MVGGTVYCQRFALSKIHAVTVFHVYVQHQGGIHHLRIIDTPYLHRLLSIYGMTTRYLDTALTYPVAMRLLELRRQKIA